MLRRNMVIGVCLLLLVIPLLMVSLATVDKAFTRNTSLDPPNCLPLYFKTAIVFMSYVDEIENEPGGGFPAQQGCVIVLFPLGAIVNSRYSWCLRQRFVEQRRQDLEEMVPDAEEVAVEMEEIREFHQGAFDDDAVIEALDEELYEDKKPRLLELVRTIDSALRSIDSPCYDGWEGPIANAYVGGCYKACKAFTSLAEAQQNCEEANGQCGGVTKTGEQFEMRKNDHITPSKGGESSYVRKKCSGWAQRKHMSHAEKIYDTFQATVDKSLR
jgi:hypothetical protein